MQGMTSRALETTLVGGKASSYHELSHCWVRMGPLKISENVQQRFVGDSNKDRGEAKRRMSEKGSQQDRQTIPESLIQVSVGSG